MKKLILFWRFWRAWCDQEKLKAQLLAAAEARGRLKGRLDAIGQLVQLPDGNIWIKDWRIDCSNGAMPQRVGLDGTYYFCGYTVAELMEIHARKKEFEPAQAQE